MALVMTDMGRFGSSGAGAATAELAAADLNAVQVLNTWALVALNVTRLWSRLSSPSTPLCVDHGFCKLVRSSSSTGQETKISGKSESLDIAGAWRSMLANDYIDDNINWPPRSTCPAFISSSASAPQRRACIQPPQAAASFVQQVAVKKFVATCNLQGGEGPSSCDSFSLPTCLLPSHDHSCSPPAHALLPWVSLHGLGTHAASDTDAASFSSSHAPTPQATHNSSSSNNSSSQHASTFITATASQAGAPFLPRPDFVCLVQAHAPASPADLECTALASSVLVEVRSMLRAMGAYPAKGIIIPAGAAAPLVNATSCSASLPSAALPLYNASLSAQLGSGAAVGRGGFGSVYSGVWEGQAVAIKRVPFTAVPAQRSALRNALQPITNVNAGCSAQAKRAAPHSSWRLPNGILMECAHAMVLGGGCSSVSFDGAVNLKTWSICPLPPAASVDGGIVHTHELLLVMPLLKRSLDQALQQHLSPADALSAAHDVVLAVASLHAHGTIHGDIKCGNCMVDADTGSWLLLDFGLAATLKGNMCSAAARGSSQGHAAPELLAEGRISTATDVYAAGVMLHRLLTHKSVMRGAPAWWSEAVMDAAAPAAASALASAGLAGSAEKDGCSAVTHLLQLLHQAQADSPSARPSMPQLCEAVQAAVEASAVVWVAPKHGSTACGTDGSTGTEGHSLDAAGSAENAMQESSSPTFSTITTDPNWSSMSSEPIDEDFDDDNDVAGVEEGDVVSGSSGTSDGA